jgi:hypothetical protein
VEIRPAGPSRTSSPCLAAGAAPVSEPIRLAAMGNVAQQIWVRLPLVAGDIGARMGVGVE